MIRKTRFINKYDYGKNIVELDEYVVSLGTNCSLKCEYCYLKFSKTPPKPTIYENLNKLKEELLSLFTQNPQKIFYFNFGETTDSFLTKKHFEILEKIVEIISILSKEYKKFCFIEFRTKTSNIFKFGKKINYQNIKPIYATTLTPQLTIEEFEKGTANLEERIKTLQLAESLGFLTGVRFEPIILYPVLGVTYNELLTSIENLIETYKNLIKDTLEKLNFDYLHSISLSTLRLTKKQFKILKQQQSKLCFFEMFLCPDGKFRYSRPIRLTIYNKLINSIKDITPNLTQKILLSFEPEYIWKNCKIKLKTLPELSQIFL